ncbi:xanthine dehydrogenase family protein molybdopterin-binding subunit [Altericroceibacterium spongiae]|uniref:Xanthine dehydrogenase family protein molybdopterin-binding subunit n=1 Tax=Altericroceibacterium spongiae TaxID=2320269 RepID=A0A420EPU8_9SPHN|nr:molybdopterin cofactor-binding domain-containing protein [Altericroceibacterium spongiae]RKF22715.1 xanthine dehydrogenase family protein molybdopterin-binding subunit [Altericroceibacterium spongiae]
MTISRRGLLAGAAVGGGLLVAWSFVPRHYDAPLPAGRDEYSFDAWLKIAADGVVTVAIPQIEMGQGVTTLLAQIVAMELGADWRQVAVEPAPISGAYPNLALAARWAPLWRPALPALADDPDDWLLRRWAETNRFAVTADGMSLAAYEEPCRAAAASVRAMLAKVAAKRWDVDWLQCDAQNGFIVHGDKRLRFAELAEEAVAITPPDPAPLRPELPRDPSDPLELEERTAFPRLDLPSKVDGSFLFSGDVRLPDLVFAAIRHGPVTEAVLSSFDRDAASERSDLVGVVQGKRWLAAVATNWWAAEKALDAMAPRFTLPNPVDSGRIERTLDQAVKQGDAQRIYERGDGDGGMGEPSLSFRYNVAPAVHGTIETASATARLLDGKLELWIATQAPDHARRAAARALDMSPADVVLYPMPAGGSFDRRLDHDHAIEVALIARETGRPVQLTWSRWQEQLALRPRTPVAAEMSVKLTPEGDIAMLHGRVALPATVREFGARLFENMTDWAAMAEMTGVADPMALEGLAPAYSIAHVALDHVPATIGLPTGRLRGNAHGYTAFFTESLIDEVATLSRREPLAYRMKMLGDDPRLAECLQRVARLGAWGGGADNSGQGLACHHMGPLQSGGRIALIAKVVVGEHGIEVQQFAAAVDIGRIVNRDIALQQIEGGLIYGLGLALGSATGYQRGLPTHGQLADLSLPRLASTPEIMIDLIESDAEAFDPGELSVAPVAPAIANALYSATGLRLRHLPLHRGEG